MGECDFMAGEQANVLAVELLAQGAGQKDVSIAPSRAGNDAFEAGQAGITRLHIGGERLGAQRVAKGLLSLGSASRQAAKRAGR